VSISVDRRANTTPRCTILYYTKERTQEAAKKSSLSVNAMSEASVTVIMMHYHLTCCLLQQTH
jgi:hypothetical protein